MIAATVAVLLGGPAPAWADPAAAVADVLARAGLRGSLAFDYFSSNHDLDDQKNFPGLNLVLRQRRGLGAGVRWVGELRVLAQQEFHHREDASYWSSRALRYSDETTAELREGYFELAGEHLELRVGKQIVTWGRADEINPTDVITPKNYTLLLPEGLSAYRFGLPAVRLDGFLPGGFRVTGIWAPFFVPSVIPLEAPPPGVTLGERLPPIRFEDGSAGFKIDRSGGTVDASLAYFYGFNTLPVLQVDSIAADPETGALDGRVVQTHGRQHMIGADFATAHGRWGYRGEVAWVQTDNPHGRQVDEIVPYLFYVLGIERSFEDDLSVILQYVGRWVPDRVDPARALADPDPLNGEADFLAARETFIINQQLDTVQNGWSIRLDKRWWNQTLDTEMLAVHYIERNDFFLRPKIAYEISDGWRATVGAEIFGGPAVSFFGRVKKNTGAFVELSRSF